MKRMAWAAAVCAVSLAAYAQEPKSPTGGAEQSCGQMLSDSAKYPKQLAKTLDAVAENYDAHAKWVGTKTAAAKAEHDQLQKLAREVRDMEKRATELEKTYTASAKLKAAPHDMKNVPSNVTASMEKLRDEQKKFGEMLTQGAQEMDQELQKMRGVGGSGQEQGQPSEKSSTPGKDSEHR